MGRVYERKSDRSSYSKASLDEAVSKVKNGEISGYGAAKIYGIPRMTIMDRVNGKKGTKSTSLGRGTALKKEVEVHLANNLHIMEKRGFGLTRKDVINLVGEYVNCNNIVTPFKNGYPGKEWFSAFAKRNKLSIKKPQGVENSRRKACDPYIIKPYFKLLEETISELNLKDKPGQIWNFDETSFCNDPKKTKVVGVTGYPATRTIASNGKKNTTVLLGVSADGKKAPPLIIFSGKYMWDEWTSPKAYEGTAYAATSNGWMESEVFYNYFKNTFLEITKRETPILVIYDGHSTHVQIKLIDLARENGITLLKMPPHSSHILQPLDLSVMKPFKDKWDQNLVAWQRLNIGTVLPKKEFSRILGEVWSQIKPEIIMKGFAKSGIFPLNEACISDDVYDLTQLQKYYADTTHENREQPEIQNLQTEKEFHTRIERDVNTRNDVENYEQNGNTNFNDQQYMIQQENTPNDIVIENMEKQNAIGTEKQKIYTVINDLCGHQKSTGAEKLMKTYKINAQIHNEENQCHRNIIINTVPSLPSCSVPKEKPKIISNVLVKPADVSFESLLLQTLRKGTQNKTKKNRIGLGAEVITYDDVRQRYLKKENEKKNKTKNSKEKTKYKSKKSGKLVNKRKNQRKDSTTSVSDDMSEHTDSDIISSGEHADSDIISSDEHLDDVYMSDHYSVENVTESELPITKGDLNNYCSTMEHSNYTDEMESRDYHINDNVIVRYYVKNIWKYYVGTIENIQGEKYAITFRKTVKHPVLTFKTNKKDHDIVPVTCIVKKTQIELKPNGSLMLSNEEDETYFS